MTKPILTFRARLDGKSSYFFHAVNILRWFDREHFCQVLPVVIEPGAIPKPLAEMIVHRDQPTNKEVVIHDPTFDPVGESDKKVCFVTMWETTRLPEPAVKNLNKAEVVVVPSKWQAEVFSAQGVTAPIRVVPMGVDPKRFPFQYREHRGPFVFGSAGNLAVGGCRKNMPGVIQAFQKADIPNSKLVIKTYPDDVLPEIEDSRIEFQQVFLSSAEISSFYGRIDCFVSATRGEGWGLMQHEAMLSGVPVVSPAFGGISEFFDASVGYPVDYRTVESGKHYENCGHWAEPSTESLIKGMKAAVGFEMHAQVRAARERVEGLTWGHSNTLLLEVLREFAYV